MNKFEKGDIITNGNVTFRVEKIGRNFLGYYYSLVNVDDEKKGLRYLKHSDGSNFGETLCLCEQIDKKFHIVVKNDKPKESDDERIRKEIIDLLRHAANCMPADKFNERIAWLERQGKKPQDADEKIRKALINVFATHKDYEMFFGVSVKDICDWLEKQGSQPNKVSIWKHWKDGIAGNGDGIPVFLIKNGFTYSLSSCLGFECDYIELSELDNLMLEKQGEQKELSQ